MEGVLPLLPSLHVRLPFRTGGWWLDYSEAQKVSSHSPPLRVPALVASHSATGNISGRNNQNFPWDSLVASARRNEQTVGQETAAAEKAAVTGCTSGRAYGSSFRAAQQQTLIWKKKES